MDLSRPRIWPSQQQAQRYLSTMLASIGRLQHLVEPGIVNQRLSETYFPKPETHRVEGLWYVQLSLVFAIGRLLDGDAPDVDDQPPGYEYFSQAMDLLPNACVLQGAETLGIEITALITFYLQCSERKDDAYIYVRTPLILCRLKAIISLTL